jgi:hypothetical protein
MLKLWRNVELKDCHLLLSFSSVGLAGNFASSLLINNHNFENIGFLFSKYLSPYAGVNEETGKINYNGQCYLNSEKKILLINFQAGVPHHFRNLFCEELLQLSEKYSLRNITIYGGISKVYLNDEELRNVNIQVYYLTNDESFDGGKIGLKNFESLVKLENKKKALQETMYIEQCGVAKHLVKFLYKKKVPFYYFFAFSLELFDPSSGLALYFRLSNLLNFSQEGIMVQKREKNLSGLLDSIEEKFKIEKTWKLFLKE